MRNKPRELDPWNHNMANYQPGELTWLDVLTASYEDLDAYSRNFDSGSELGTVETSERIRAFAELRALDIEDKYFRDTEAVELLRFATSRASAESLDPELIKSIVSTINIIKDRYASIVYMNAARFQRVYTAKLTGDPVLGKGRLYESVYVLPNDRRIRIFHHMFNDPGKRVIAERAQLYYFDLVRAIKADVGTRFRDEDAEYVRERIARADPIKPLTSRRNRISNAFVEGSDLGDRLVDEDLATRAEFIAEANDIDIITGVYSTKYREKKGRGLFSGRSTLPTLASIVKGQKFPEIDYRDHVFEDILLRAHKPLRTLLEDNGIIVIGGNKIRDKKRFAKIFYNGQDRPEKAVLELLGSDTTNVAVPSLIIFRFM